ncbi:LysM peptidoglycan-binding domain-containing protein [Paenibacillus barengoltzii]|uniref:LysM peptidoglycan-binding domain-containing protein n=1 Tax=Paenibacillus barengoltzii TaxID=343517 RepID=UPI002FD99335
MLNYYYRQCPAEHYPYTVQPGDTLNIIAFRLESSVTRILAANPGLDPNNLQIGQVICIPSCPPNHVSRIIQPGDTLYQIAQEYGVTIASILEANPGVDPNSLRVGQRLCIPQIGGAPDVSGLRETITAMQSDINTIKADSSVQQTHESNYGNSTQTTRVLSVTPREIRFEAVPVTFTGAFRGHFTAGRRYPYYVDASMGGRRTLNVKDNFGVWHSLNYREQTPQS